ncbi:MAG: transcriptional regulator [Fusobacteriia bacterium 4572_132]|nr:MAG: transcriptional regulator [Fusobacteriia bacterium 4572_132]
MNLNSLEELLNEIGNKNAKYNSVVFEGDGFDQKELIRLIEKITKIDKKIIILVVGERTSFEIVAGAIKAGAYDYILKPIDSVKIMKVAEKALKDQKLKAEKLKGNSRFFGEEKIIGTTDAMVEVYKTIGKVAESNVGVMITGESGTGKELIAKTIHDFSDNKTMPFITMKCTSNLLVSLEKDLFGYKNTEHDQKLSKFELAYGGTLFLEEICDLDLEMQAKLLEALQKKRFTRVGDNEELKINIRLIASSTKDLDDMVLEGSFREDLYHRLRVVEINVPPLRERKDDIPFLIDYFRKLFNEELEKNIKGISKPAMTKMMKYDWPTNISELKNAVKSAMAISRGNAILIEDLPANVIEVKISKRHGDMQDWVLADWLEGEIGILQQNEDEKYYNIIISRVERELIRQILEKTNGKKVDTAKLLGITRNTLRTKMSKYGLE